MERKPTLLQLRREYNYDKKHPISSSDLARAANLPLSVTYAVEIGGFVQRATAIKVLQAFSRLVGSNLHLSDIKVYTERAY
ncbi:hypothetical protein ccbrp13_46440 [Ktedonobacteria bacterium brp13]|nr:hypothetical protein ccbrp13_46440 [Ktedonobacteria bacterium brp13]